MAGPRSLDYAKDVAPALADDRLDAPAFHRNRDAMFAVLRDLTDLQEAHVLEIASGTGQHAADFAVRWPRVTWWPSDLDAGHIKSIDAWARHAGAANVMPAGVVDVTARPWLNNEPHDDWPEAFDVIIAANMIHIAPWAAAIGLIVGASKRLAASGILLIYGPFKANGEHTAPSNQAFDDSLKSRDPSWGVRDISAIEDLAALHQLTLAETIEMPANNLILVLRRTVESGS